MSKRSAIPTIKGYLYQFNYSILRILESSKLGEKIIVEHIEDVDHVSENEYIAIQCKYYEETEYNHSKIAPAIRLMLENFNERLTNEEDIIKYMFYGFYESGQDKLCQPISIDFLKAHLLTFTEKGKKRIYHDELSISEDNLKLFLSHLEVNINAANFDEQYDSIIKILKTQFNCTDFEAECYYYNNALRVINNLAICKNDDDRLISKGDFLTNINGKELLFNMWYRHFRTEKEVFRRIKSEFFSPFNVEPYERFFLLEVDLSNYDRVVLKELIFLIIKNWSSSKHKRPATQYSPYVYIHNLNQNELVALKKALYDEDISFIDGYPYLDSGFVRESLCKVPHAHSKLAVKILSDAQHITDILTHFKTTREIYQFYLNDAYYDFSDQNVKHVKIQVANIANLKEII